MRPDYCQSCGIDEAATDCRTTLSAKYARCRDRSRGFCLFAWPAETASPTGQYSAPSRPPEPAPSLAPPPEPAFVPAPVPSRSARRVLPASSLPAATHRPPAAAERQSGRTVSACGHAPENPPNRTTAFLHRQLKMHGHQTPSGLRDTG